MYTPPREYSREFKIQTMREIDAGRRIVEVARQPSPAAQPPRLASRPKSR